MNEINDGGPAFPECVQTLLGPGIQHGMSLRDYFAGRAMVGIVSALQGGIRPADIQAMAADCYGLADAMLAERAKGAAK